MINLIVGEKQLQTDGKTRFAFSKAAAKFGELYNRHGEVSVNFSVPYTSINNEIFGGIMRLRKASYSGASEKFPAYLEEFGSILSVGYMQILKGSLKRITMRFFGGNSQWFNQLKDDNLQGEVYREENGESYLKEFDHVYNVNSITGSFGNTTGMKYILFDNGTNIHTDTKIETEPKDYLMNIFRHTLIEKIFKLSDLKIKGNLFSSPLYFSTMVCAHRSFKHYEREKYEKTFVANVNTNLGFRPNKVTPVYFPNGNQDPQFNGSRFTFNQNYPNLDSALYYVIEGQSSIDWTGFTFHYEYKRVGDAVSTLQVNPMDLTDILESDAGGSVRKSTIIRLENLLPNPQAGDWLQLNGIEWQGIGNAILNVKGYYGEGLGTNMYVNFGNDISHTVDAADEMPTISMSDFVKDMMIQHGVFSQYDANTRTVEFTRFDTIKENEVNAPDWSKYFDATIRPEVDFRSVTKNYGKISHFKYLNDDTDLIVQAYNTVSRQSDFGDGKININNDFLHDEETVYESTFSATLNRWTFPYDIGSNPVAGTVFLPYIPFFSGEDDVQSQPRILINAGNIPIAQISTDQVPTIFIRESNAAGVGNPISSFGYGFFAKPKLLTGSGDRLTQVESVILNSNVETMAFETPLFSPLLVAETLLDKNYSLMKNVLNNSFLLPVYLLLPPDVVANIQFKIPIYLSIEEVTGYFYIEQVYQYKGREKSTLVRLVKI